mgnify:FL=1
MNDIKIKYECGEETKSTNVDILDLITQLNSNSQFCVLDDIVVNKNKIIEIKRIK